MVKNRAKSATNKPPSAATGGKSSQSQPVVQPPSERSPESSLNRSPERSPEKSAPPRYSLPRLLLLAAVFAAVVVLGGWVGGGKSLAEKTTIRLVQPIGVFWLLFSGWCIEVTYARLAQQLVHRRSQLAQKATQKATGQVTGQAAKRSAAGDAVRLAAPAASWLIFMIFTTTPLCGWCVMYLESGVESYRPESGEPLAAVVVLGGGTHQGPWRAQVSGAGDRVMYAAQIYHQGQARRLITTGEATPGVSRDMTSPSEHTTEIWTKLNIPASDIGTLKGQNTFQELQDLKQHWSEFNGGRVGLLTSALHLPRAMRLAKAAELDVVPIAADHLANDAPLNYLDFIPSAGPLNQLAACQHEFMAWIVKR